MKYVHINFQRRDVKYYIQEKIFESKEIL
jgi:hypothetical protein